MSLHQAAQGPDKIFDNLESNVRSYCRDFPVVFTKAQGSTLVDHTGKNYIDFFSGADALKPIVYSFANHFQCNDVGFGWWCCYLWGIA